MTQLGNPEAAVLLKKLDEAFANLHGELVIRGSLFSESTRSGPVDHEIYLKVLTKYSATAEEERAKISRLNDIAKRRELTHTETKDHIETVAKLRRANIEVNEFLRHSYPVDGEQHLATVEKVGAERRNLLLKVRTAQIAAIQALQKNPSECNQQVEAIQASRKNPSECNATQQSN